MNTFFTQLKKEAEEIRLTPKERTTMLVRLEQAMQVRPLQSNSGVSIPSPYFFFMPRFMAPLAFVLILVMVGGGTAYAAEGAVPGDILYPIKIAVTEPLRGSLAISNEAKLAWHAESAVRRLQEAETLAVRGTFTAAFASELEKKLDLHVAQVNAIVETVEKENPVLAARVSARLATSLGAHGAVIARLGSGSEDSTTREESEDFAERVNTQERTLARAEKARASGRAGGEAADTLAVRAFAQMPAPSSSETSGYSDTDRAVALELEGNASTTLAAAEAVLRSLRHTLTATTTQKIETQIAEVRAQIERARAKRESGENASATRDAKSALRDATTLQVFLEAQGKFRERILPRVLNVNSEIEIERAMLKSAEGKDQDKDEDVAEDEQKEEEGDDFVPKIRTTPLQF